VHFERPPCRILLRINHFQGEVIPSNWSALG
jgi:hypothetical protein